MLNLTGHSQQSRHFGKRAKKPSTFAKLISYTIELDFKLISCGPRQQIFCMCTLQIMFYQYQPADSQELPGEHTVGPQTQD